MNAKMILNGAKLLLTSNKIQGMQKTASESIVNFENMLMQAFSNPDFPNSINESEESKQNFGNTVIGLTGSEKESGEAETESEIINVVSGEILNTVSEIEPVQIKDFNFNDTVEKEDKNPVEGKLFGLKQKTEEPEKVAVSESENNGEELKISISDLKNYSHNDSEISVEPLHNSFINIERGNKIEKITKTEEKIEKFKKLFEQTLDKNNGYEEDFVIAGNKDSGRIKANKAEESDGKDLDFADADIINENIQGQKLEIVEQINEEEEKKEDSDLAQILIESGIMNPGADTVIPVNVQRVELDTNGNFKINARGEDISINEKEFVKAEAKTADLKETPATAENEFEKAEAKAADLIETTAMAENEFEKAEAKAADLKETTATAENESVKAEAKTADLKEAPATAENEFVKAEVKTADLKETPVTAENEFVKTEVKTADLKETPVTAENESEKAEAKTADLKETPVTAENEFVKAEAKTADLKETPATAENEFVKAEAKTADLKETPVTAENEFVKAEAKTADLKEAPAAAESEFVKAEAKTADLKETPATAENEFVKAEAKTADLKEAPAAAESESVKAEAKTADLADLKEAPAAAEDEFVKAEAKTADLKETPAAAEDEFVKAEAKTADLEEPPAAAENEFVKAEAKTADLKETTATAENESVKAEAKTADLEETPAAAENEFVKAEAGEIKFGKAKAKIADLKESAATAENESVKAETMSLEPEKTGIASAKNSTESNNRDKYYNSTIENVDYREKNITDRDERSAKTENKINKIEEKESSKQKISQEDYDKADNETGKTLNSDLQSEISDKPKKHHENILDSKSLINPEFFEKVKVHLRKPREEQAIKIESSFKNEKYFQEVTDPNTLTKTSNFSNIDRAGNFEIEAESNKIPAVDYSNEIEKRGASNPERNLSGENKNPHEKSFNKTDVKFERILMNSTNILKQVKDQKERIEIPQFSKVQFNDESDKGTQRAEMQKDMFGKSVFGEITGDSVNEIDDKSGSENDSNYGYVAENYHEGLVKDVSFKNIPEQEENSAAPQKADIEDFAKQFSEKYASNKQEFSIQLFPKELGKVAVKFILEAGKLNLEIVTALPKTKALLSSQTEELISGINAKNIKIDTVTVVTQTEKQSGHSGGYFSNNEFNMNSQTGSNTGENHQNDWRRDGRRNDYSVEYTDNSNNDEIIRRKENIIVNRLDYVV